MSYFLPEGYTPRLGAIQDFVGENRVTDDCQKEVYEEARKLADAFGYKRVADVGAGGGYKFVTMFRGDFDLVGFDLPEGVKMLQEKYPQIKWQTTKQRYDFQDLVICSDVIEHVDDPDELCTFIKSMAPKRVVISTPDRELVVQRYGQPPLGPPRNKCHVMEWDFDEFSKYMATHFEVEKMFYSNKAQCTICMVGKPKC